MLFLSTLYNYGLKSWFHIEHVLSHYSLTVTAYDVQKQLCLNDLYIVSVHRCINDISNGMKSYNHAISIYIVEFKV